MTQAELLASRERVVEISPGALDLICPERRLARPASRLSRLRAGMVLWLRRLRGRCQLRLGDLQPLRCRIVRWRLGARIAWMRLRHRGRL